MSKKQKISSVIVMIISAAIYGAIRWFGLEDSGLHFRLISMAALVIAAKNAVSLVLSLLCPKNNRVRTIVSMLISMLSYAAVIVVFCWALTICGVDVKAIVASLGVIALVIGFGAESLIADLVTGLFMIVENQYNVGDIVEVNGFRGTVKNIGIRTTAIMDTGKNVKIINNSDMKNILNRSDNASIAGATIDIPYETNLLELEKKIPGLMDEIYEKHKDVMLSAPRYLGVQELGASGITLKFIAEVEEANIFSAPRILNHDLLIGFKSFGVECPFPQVDVHSK